MQDLRIHELQGPASGATCPSHTPALPLLVQVGGYVQWWEIRAVDPHSFFADPDLSVFFDANPDTA